MKRRDVLKGLLMVTGAALVAPPVGAKEAEVEAKAPQPPCCKICGKTQEEAQLVCFINPFRPNEAAQMAWCCRHGHFRCTITDPVTGMPVYMMGPKWAIPTVELFSEDWEEYNAVPAIEGEGDGGFYEDFKESNEMALHLREFRASSPPASKRYMFAFSLDDEEVEDRRRYDSIKKSGGFQG